jgi:hypothetical protein
MLGMNGTACEQTTRVNQVAVGVGVTGVAGHMGAWIIKVYTSLRYTDAESFHEQQHGNIACCGWSVLVTT